MGNNTTAYKWHGKWKSEENNLFGNISTNYDEPFHEYIKNLTFIMMYDKDSDYGFYIDQMTGIVNITKMPNTDSYYMTIFTPNYTFNSHIKNDKFFEGRYYGYSDSGIFQMILD